METIEFLENINKQIVARAVALKFDSPEFAALEQIKANIEWHKSALRHSK